MESSSASMASLQGWWKQVRSRAARRGRWDPVSYTHLDVYKRQVLLCAALLGGMLWVYQAKTDKTVTQISRVYLGELTEQVMGHFQTSLDSQFSQVVTVMESAGERDLADLDLSLIHI